MTTSFYRTEQVKVYLTEPQKEKVKALATRAGMKLAPYIAMQLGALTDGEEWKCADCSGEISRHYAELDSLDEDRFTV